jgi:endonuclease IV
LLVVLPTPWIERLRKGVMYSRSFLGAREGRFNDLSTEDAERFAAKLRISGIGPAFDHMPYIPNLASLKEDVYEQSVSTLPQSFTDADSSKYPTL